MNEKTTSIRYILYARKSSESEDRQVQSIDDQLKRLREIATTQHLNVVDTLTESKSAKTPDARPVYEDVLRRIHDGVANGILCWELNRLSRNPVDSGTLSWLLQRGVLRSIMTPEREYRPEDNVLLFSVESGMANQYILDLSRNVKRGRQGKLERGGLPGQAPVGYLNHHATKQVIPDPKRFAVIRQAWTLLLTGAYTVPQIRYKLTNEWGLLTPRRRRTGGRPLSHNGMYKVFHNPFYAGIIRVAGREYHGAHQPMITVEEYETAQRLLGRTTHSKSHERQAYTFSRLLRCGECGCMVTAETKTRILREDARRVTYTYYHCTFRSRRVRCSQRHYITEEALIERLADEMDNLTIQPDFIELALEVLRRYMPTEAATNGEAVEETAESITRIERQLERLTEMLYDDLVNREEYERERTKLQNRLTRSRAMIDQRITIASRLTRLESAARSLHALGEQFRCSTAEQRRVMLSMVGSNCVLLDGKPCIYAYPWIERLHGLVRVVAPDGPRFEPDSRRLDIAKAAQVRAACTHWWDQEDDISTIDVFPGEKDQQDAGSAKAA